MLLLFEVSSRHALILHVGSQVQDNLVFTKVRVFWKVQHNFILFLFIVLVVQDFHHACSDEEEFFDNGLVLDDN